MYNCCPKCQYERLDTDTGDPGICPACGLIFSKWIKQQYSSPSSVSTQLEKSKDTFEKLNLIRDWLVYVDPKTEPVFFYGRLILYSGFLVWGWNFIMMDFTIDPFEIGKSFMHRINLVFHEAGHVFFRPFGWFMTILGGTLGQLIMPIIVMLVFIFKTRDNFAASIGLWWLGQSFMDSAPYIDDALDQKLILLGGRTGADMQAMLI